MNTNKFNYILIIVWFIIVLFASFHHELWRDEARVWWFITEYDFSTLLSQIQADGHTFLWYLILFPFNKLHFPIFTMQFISLLSVFFSVYIFSFKTKFNFLIKMLFVLSSGMIFFLPVIARNYSIIPPILFSLALLFPYRNKNPFLYSFCLILLSQTHILMFGTSFIIWLLFSFEQIKSIFFAEKNKKIISICNLLIFIIYIIFIFYSCFKILQNGDNILVNKIFEPITSSKINVFIYKHMYDMMNCSSLMKYIYIFSAIILAISILIADINAFIILLISLLFIFYIFINIWFNGVLFQKFFITTLIYIFCCIISYSKVKIKNIILQTSLLIYLLISFLIFNPIEIIKNNKIYKLSNTKEISEYLKKNKVEAGKDLLLIEYEYINEDNWKVYFSKDIYKSKIVLKTENNENKIVKELEKRPKLKYLIVNYKYEDFINKTQLKQIITYKKQNRSNLYGFCSDEYYYLYKIGED